MTELIMHTHDFGSKLLHYKLPKLLSIDPRSKKP